MISRIVMRTKVRKGLQSRSQKSCSSVIINEISAAHTVVGEKMWCKTLMIVNIIVISHHESLTQAWWRSEADETPDMLHINSSKVIQKTFPRQRPKTDAPKKAMIPTDSMMLFQQRNDILCDQNTEDQNTDLKHKTKGLFETHSHCSWDPEVILHTQLLVCSLQSVFWWTLKLLKNWFPNEQLFNRMTFFYLIKAACHALCEDGIVLGLSLTAACVPQEQGQPICSSEQCVDYIYCFDFEISGTQVFSTHPCLEWPKMCHKSCAMQFQPLWEHLKNLEKIWFFSHSGPVSFCKILRFLGPKFFQLILAWSDPKCVIKVVPCSFSQFVNKTHIVTLPVQWRTTKKE